MLPRVQMASNYDDWEALYVNGVKVAEGHRVEVLEELARLGIIDHRRGDTAECQKQIAEEGCPGDWANIRRDPLPEGFQYEDELEPLPPLPRGENE